MLRPPLRLPPPPNRLPTANSLTDFVEPNRASRDKNVIIPVEGVTKCDSMSSPVVQAFFVGRALATTLSEKLEQSVTEALSNLGRFDAEQRENLRQFADEVAARAQQQAADAYQKGTVAGEGTSAEGTSQDLQATIDNLRAEIAQVRATLQQYRASLN